MNRPNVLRVNPVEEQTAFRAAVAKVLTNIQAEHDVTLLDISERIGVSLGTISNAANKKNDLCRTFINRLGQVFGGHALDPIHNLYGVRSVPVRADDHRDVLPFLSRAAMRIAEARDPQGPGGEREVHTERFAYLNDLVKLQKELTALICTIEAERDVA